MSRSRRASPRSPRRSRLPLGQDALEQDQNPLSLSSAPSPTMFGPAQDTPRPRPRTAVAGAVLPVSPLSDKAIEARKESFGKIVENLNKVWEAPEPPRWKIWATSRKTQVRNKALKVISFLTANQNTPLFADCITQLMDDFIFNNFVKDKSVETRLNVLLGFAQSSPFIADKLAKSFLNKVQTEYPDGNKMRIPFNWVDTDFCCEVMKELMQRGSGMSYEEKQRVLGDFFIRIVSRLKEDNRQYVPALQTIMKGVGEKLDSETARDLAQELSEKFKEPAVKWYGLRDGTIMRSEGIRPEERSIILQVVDALRAQAGNQPSATRPPRSTK